MRRVRFSRRDLLTAVAAGALVPHAGKLTRPARAQARAAAAEPITPALVEAATKEGKLAFYTAMDLSVAEKFAKAFEAKISRHYRSGGALWRRARVPAHRAGDGERHPCGRRGQ